MAFTWPHLTIKNLLSFVVGGCVIALAVIPLNVSADHWLWFRWQATIWILVCVALVSLLAQASLQSKEDKERDRREKARDEHSAITLKLVTRMAEKEFGPLDSVNVVVTGTSASITGGAVLVAVNASSPRIYPDIKGEGKGLFSQTKIIVSNRGADVSHTIHIESIILHSGIISFSKIETLAPDASENITATATNTDGLSQHNITSLLMKEWDAKGAVTTEFSIPIRITYEDVVHRHFQTVFDLIYFPVKDIVEQNPFEIRNLEIRLVAEKITIKRSPPN